MEHQADPGFEDPPEVWKGILDESRATLWDNEHCLPTGKRRSWAYSWTARWSALKEDLALEAQRTFGPWLNRILSPFTIWEHAHDLGTRSQSRPGRSCILRCRVASGHLEVRSDTLAIGWSISEATRRRFLVYGGGQFPKVRKLCVASWVDSTAIGVA